MKKSVLLAGSVVLAVGMFLTNAVHAEKTITVMTHDSFNISKEVMASFEKDNQVKVRFLKSGDAGAALVQAILSKDNPLADVFFGVDNTFFSRAIDADIFLPYASPLLADIPAPYNWTTRTDCCRSTTVMSASTTTRSGSRKTTWRPRPIWPT